MGRPLFTPDERLEAFWSKVNKRGPFDCWEWIGCLCGGYGQFCIGSGVYTVSHRFSYSLEYGEIADDIKVLHECDNKRCVNPNHLFLGTNKDNTQDMIAKGRSKCIGKIGERNKSSKLTDEKVLEMRRMHRSGEYNQRQISKMFGISTSVTFAVIHNQTWIHLINKEK